MWFVISYKFTVSWNNRPVNDLRLNKIHLVLIEIKVNSSTSLTDGESNGHDLKNIIFIWYIRDEYTEDEYNQNDYIFRIYNLYDTF